jgi:hypothetical protein
VAGATGFSEVRDTIERENITATDDAREQGADLEPGEPIDTGARRRSSPRSSGRTCSSRPAGGPRSQACRPERYPLRAEGPYAWVTEDGAEDEQEAHYQEGMRTTFTVS